MRLLFVQADASLAYDNEGNMYVNTNADRAIWERYRKYCDELTLLMKRDNKVYTKERACAIFSMFDRSLAEIVSVPTLRSPRRNIFNLKLRAEVYRTISEEVRRADRIIVRTPGFWLPDTVLKMCRKYGKIYMIEAIDFPSEIFRHSGFMLRRISAPYVEMKCRSEIARAPYVAYVTDHVLQERYPTRGKSVACSDVEIPALDDSVLASRLKRMRDTAGGKIIFGTVGGVSKVKGQEYVIRALSALRSEGVTGIEYQLVGAGGDWLMRLAESLGVSGQVKFLGTVPHDEISAWYDSLDVYIQPSVTESQCRSVIEAMSRGCPAACSRVGGMQEYPDKDIMFTAKNVKEIAAVMKKLLDPEERIRQARKSFDIAKNFERPKLDAVRDKFYAEFMGAGKP